MANDTDSTHTSTGDGVLSRFTVLHGDDRMLRKEPIRRSDSFNFTRLEGLSLVFEEDVVTSVRQEPVGNVCEV